MVMAALLFGSDIAREHRLSGARQLWLPGAMRLAAAERGEVALVGRHRQQIEHLCRRRRHERLRQDRDLPQHLGGDVEHRALPLRIGLGLAPRAPREAK